MIDLRNYQQFTYNKILLNNKNLIIWPRQTGKTFLLLKFLEDYIKSNYDKDILVLSNTKQQSLSLKYKMISYLFETIFKIRDKNLSLINDNYIEFSSVGSNYSHLLYKLKPDLIIFEEIYNENSDNFLELISYIDRTKCKCIFTSTYINIKTITTIDYRNDYYINLIEFFKDENSPNIKKLLYYKPDVLLDYDSKSTYTIFQRREKLKRINKISEND